VSNRPQGSGWWRASDGRWYPPQPQQGYQPPPQGYQPPPQGASGPPRKNSGVKVILIVVGVVFLVLLVGGGVGAYFIYRAVNNVLGGGKLECPSAEDVSARLGSPVSFSGNTDLLLINRCYYPSSEQSPSGIEAQIVSASKIGVDDQIAEFENAARVDGAEVRSISVGDRGLAYATPRNSQAIAVGHDAVITVQVQATDQSEIPDKTNAAIAILQKVLG
jgi:hypothetical protein